MRYLSILLLMNLTTFIQGQTAMTFLDNYQEYQEHSIEHRRFKHSQIKKLIQALPDSLFSVTQAGTSIEGREIYLVKVGRGNEKVLLWSQMHGNEPTATMAIFDIFNYLAHAQDGARQQILDKLTLYFIPMLNPDGAERFQRRNAIDIDINRDALRLTSPESRVLKEMRDEINPVWGFNLHDQNQYSSAGKTPETASISFLAPAYNEEKEWNPGRTQAMQLICAMNEVLQKHLPNKIGRYSDEFEPRAFGDNIQKWGTNTILIETGGLENDPEKQFLRKLNYEALLQAFVFISDDTYRKYSLRDYNQIPFNQGVLHDLIIRNATCHISGSDYLLDLGIRQNEVQGDNATSFYLSSYIADQGDLHNFFGYKEFDAADFQIQAAKIYPKRFKDLADLSQQNIRDLLQKGYLTFKLDTLPAKSIISRLPFQLWSATKEFVPGEIKLGGNPALGFWQEKQLKAWLINGEIYNLEDPSQQMFLQNWFLKLGLK
jgi:hypothetical protein